MSLTDLMSGADLAVYPQIALVLFLFAFAMTVGRIFGRQRPEEYERCARIVLDEGAASRKTGDNP